MTSREHKKNTVTRKAKKLLKSPGAFFKDALRKRRDRYKAKGSSSARPKNVSPLIPAWFNDLPGRELQQALVSEQPLFLYVPWIAEHGDALIRKLQSECYLLSPLDFVRDIQLRGRRKEVLRFAYTYPDVYRRMLMKRLIPLRGRIAGVILTFDWAPAMRIISIVCRDLGIPTILVPHESVFIDRDKYYRDIRAKSSVPSTDVVLGWGELQKSIFCGRGYPSERFLSVGTPKFDIYASGSTSLTREEFCHAVGLDAGKKLVLFATQNLDSQIDTILARDAQRKSIKDIVELLEENGAQLIIRLPPSKEDVLGPELRSFLEGREDVFIDEAHCYILPPDEMVILSDIVVSINSTMLLEAVLAGKPSLSVKYVEFEQIWRDAGIPSASSRSDLEVMLPQLLSGEWTLDAGGLAWAESQFSHGSFDGQSARRIREFLGDVATGQRVIEVRGSAAQRLMNGDSLDVVAIHSKEEASETTQRYLKEMLQARTLIYSRNLLKQNVVRDLCTTDVFLQWGITPSGLKESQRKLARRLGRPVVIVEEGLLRSMDIGLSGVPALSLIFDKKTAYYDAENVSMLAEMLQNGPDLSEGERQRALRVMQSIRRYRLSKYNHAPDLKLSIGENKSKVLLVDQRYGDQSVLSGLADEHSFRQMVSDALARHPESDIIVKLHPDAIKGDKGSYITSDIIPANDPRIHLIDYDVNPHALFDIVDDVYVVTSGMGFEALMAGKRVHCYGMPFYAGWGVTNDKISLPSRTRKRSVEEIFHFTYIKASRYYSPQLGRSCEIEDLVEYLASQTSEIGLAA